MVSYRKAFMRGVPAAVLAVMLAAGCAGMGAATKQTTPADRDAPAPGDGHQGGRTGWEGGSAGRGRPASEELPDVQDGETAAPAARPARRQARLISARTSRSTRGRWASSGRSSRATTPPPSWNHPEPAGGLRGQRRRGDAQGDHRRSWPSRRRLPRPPSSGWAGDQARRRREERRGTACRLPPPLPRPSPRRLSLPRGPAARKLTGIDILSSPEGTQVVIEGDGNLDYEYFLVENKMVVVDIQDVANSVAPLTRKVVRRVRQAGPDRRALRAPPEGPRGDRPDPSQRIQGRLDRRQAAGQLR